MTAKEAFDRIGYYLTDIKKDELGNDIMLYVHPISNEAIVFYVQHLQYCKGYDYEITKDIETGHILAITEDENFAIQLQMKELGWLDEGMV